MNPFDIFAAAKLQPFLTCVSAEDGRISLTIKHGEQANIAFDALWEEPETFLSWNGFNDGFSHPDRVLLIARALLNSVGAKTRRGLGNMLLAGDAEIVSLLQTQMGLGGVKIIHMPELPANELRALYHNPAGLGTAVCDGPAQYVESNLYVNGGYQNYFARAII